MSTLKHQRLSIFKIYLIKRKHFYRINKTTASQNVMQRLKSSTCTSVHPSPDAGHSLDHQDTSTYHWSSWRTVHYILEARGCGNWEGCSHFNMAFKANWPIESFQLWAQPLQYGVLLPMTNQIVYRNFGKPRFCVKIFLLTFRPGVRLGV